jgi:hypothetical protein
VAAPEQTLEALVKDELRGPVREIVRRLVPELVAETLNGVAAAPVEVEPASTANGATPAAKVCRSCGVEKSADQFGKGRRVCKACRREQGRAWEDARAARRREQRTHAPAAALDDDGRVPVPELAPGPRARRSASSKRGYWLRPSVLAQLERERRELIEGAEVSYEWRDGRRFVVRHLAPSAPVSSRKGESQAPQLRKQVG